MRWAIVLSLDFVESSITPMQLPALAILSFAPGLHLGDMTLDLPDFRHSVD